MFDAQLLLTKTDGSAVSLLSPWTSRGADYLLATLDLVQTNMGTGLGVLEVRVFHKDPDDTGDGTQVGSTTISRATAGRTTAEFGPLKQLVRYKFTISAGGMEVTGWALFRMLSPVWFDAVKA